MAGQKPGKMENLIAVSTAELENVVTALGKSVYVDFCPDGRTLCCYM